MLFEKRIDFAKISAQLIWKILIKNKDLRGPDLTAYVIANTNPQVTFSALILSINIL
jgi:hypothetical protein